MCLGMCSRRGAAAWGGLAVGLLLILAIVPRLHEARAEDLPARQDERQTVTLPEARAGFKTQLRESGYQPDGPVPKPPKEVFRLVRYKSPAGQLVACLTPDPKDGKRRPAVLWCHGGFGGIGDYYWSPQPATNDQTPKAFIDAGFVVMLPAWRGENDNPGRFEMFYGEVDDALAALDHLRGLPYVDPSRVYLVGHSSGGTVGLLAALSTDKLRAAIIFGGVPDARHMRNGWGHIIPFDPQEDREFRLRSPVDFIGTLKTPTWYIEGRRAAVAADAERMQEIATAHRAPLTTVIIEGGGHFDILRPSTTLLAKALLQDDGAGPFELALKPADLQRAFDAARKEQLAKRRHLPPVRLTSAAVAEIKKILADQEMRADKVWLALAERSLDLTERFDPKTQTEREQDGLRLAVAKDDEDALRGIVIDFVDDENGRGFKFLEEKPTE